MTHKRMTETLLICISCVSIFVTGHLSAAENRAYVIQFYSRFDKNSDGLLEPIEWKSSRSRDVVAEAIEDAGLDPETPVSLKAVIDTRLKSSSKSRKDEKDKPRGYRVKIGQQRLDKSVPEWFRERDGDGDGQVAMAEYAKDWTDKLVDEFLNLDANRDGVITPEESLDADDKPSDRTSVASASTSRSKYGSRTGSSSSRAPGSDKTASSKTPDSASPKEDKSEASSDSVDKTETAAASATQGTESAEGIPANVLGYAKSIVKKYDTNGDGSLSKDEWSEMSMDPSAADTDGDKKITYIEYARLISRK